MGSGGLERERERRLLALLVGDHHLDRLCCRFHQARHPQCAEVTPDAFEHLLPFLDRALFHE